jgi:hypothetical protein
MTPRGRSRAGAGRLGVEWASRGVSSELRGPYGEPRRPRAYESHPLRWRSLSAAELGHTLASMRRFALVLALSGLLAAPAVSATAKTSRMWKPRDVIAALRKAGLPIGAVQYYTPANDPNKLLGRPGQYTGKANFRDHRAQDGSGYDVNNGGSIETFANKGDANRRFRYVEAISQSSSLFVEYDYLEGTVLLRVSHNLTPAQAKAYETRLRRAV